MMTRFKLSKMFMNSFKWMLPILAILLLGSCKSEYDQLVRKELNSGVQNDSLIFNMYLGETRKDFFANCWQLNKDQIITQGSGNRYARLIEPLDSADMRTDRKQMDFYGIFDEQEVMHGMEMIFTYLSWAPWNKERFSEALIVDLQKQFLNDYGGNEFLDIQLKEARKTAHVKVDGNMQILMFIKNNKEVVVRMEDLNYKLKNK